MSIHDWTRVDPGIFHAFHLHWVAELDQALNQGLLPPDYYALPEQVAGPGNPDVLTLQLNQPGAAPTPPANGARAAGGGGVVAAAVPPKVQFRDQADSAAYARKTRAVVVRHAASADRIVAVIEVVSPGNKSSRHAVRAFTEKAADFLALGVHLLLLDLFPPGPRDPQGIHPLIWSEFKPTAFELPPGKPLTLAAYAAGPMTEAFVQPVGVGDALPDMPLFLTAAEYVPVPLEATYQAAWSKVPGRWRRVLEPHAP